MARRLNAEQLKERAIQMLPKNIPAEAIYDVDVDRDGYWIYLEDGFISVTTESHTIHEMNLSDLKDELQNIEVEQIKEKPEPVQEDVNWDVKFDVQNELNEMFPIKGMEYRNGVTAKRIAKGKDITEDWVMKALLEDVSDEFITYEYAVSISEEYYKAAKRMAGR